MRRFALILMSLLAACTYRVELGELALESEGPAELDVLFVIDDSGTMGEEQAALAEGLSLLMNELEAAPGGMPSLHLGVISTNVGAGGYGISGCEGGGDGGALLAIPRVSGCEPPTDDYLSDLPIPEGGRERNYDGSLAEAFTCIGLLGTNGCGFEQPLESMRLALTGAGELNACELAGGTCFPGALACPTPEGVVNPDPCGETEEPMTCCAADYPLPDNQGFLRPDALLAVIIVTDEDDCSASDSALFDTTSTELDDPLGPLGSFRCVEFGVTCDDGAVTRESATYATCEPQASSAYVAHPDEYVEFLTSLKEDPGEVVVSVIAGPTSALEVVLEAETTSLRTEPACDSDYGVAYGGYRLAHFAGQFEYGTFASICTGEFGDALSETGRSIATAIEAATSSPVDPDNPDDPEPSGCAVTPDRDAPAIGWLLILMGLAMLRIRRRR